MLHTDSLIFDSHQRILAYLFQYNQRQSMISHNTKIKISDYLNVLVFDENLTKFLLDRTSKSAIESSKFAFLKLTDLVDNPFLSKADH